MTDALHVPVLLAPILARAEQMRGWQIFHALDDGLAHGRTSGEQGQGWQQQVHQLAQLFS